jgi:hypothetical protein
MLTDDQLADQLRTQLHREVAAIQPRTDLLASLRRRQARRTLALQMSIVGVPVTAAAVAVSVLVAGGGSAGSLPVSSAVVTAATVHEMANASRLALAHSGRVVIAYRERTNGALQDTGKYGITFSGNNWNAVISQAFPASNGQPASTQTAINRIVNGQFYLHTEGKNGRVEWLHDTNPNGHPSMPIPDPRTLFRLLNPSAKFKIVAHRVTDGVRLTQLRATRAARQPALNWLPGAVRGAHVALLTVWVDRHHVVHEMSLRVSRHDTVDPLYFKKFANGKIEVLVPSKAYLKEARAMARKLRKHYKHVIARVDPSLTGTVRHYLYVTSTSVTFSDFGKRQVITAPRHAVPVFSRG